MMAEGPLRFKTALQRVTAQSTMEAELISMALASKEAVYFSSGLAELGLGKLFHSARLFVDNTQLLYTLRATARIAHARNTSPYQYDSFLQELVKEGWTTIHLVAATKQLVDMGINFLSKSTHRLQL